MCGMINEERKPIHKKKWIMLAVAAGIILLVVFLVKSFYSFTEFEDEPANSSVTDRVYPPERESERGYPPEPTTPQAHGAAAVLNSMDKGYPSDPKTAPVDPPSESRDGSSDAYSEEKGYPPEPDTEKGYPPEPDTDKGYPPES